MLRFTKEEKYGGLGSSKVRRLKQLEEKEVKLKKLVADLSLGKAMLQDILSENLQILPASGR